MHHIFVIMVRYTVAYAAKFFPASVGNLLLIKSGMFKVFGLAWTMRGEFVPLRAEVLTRISAKTADGKCIVAYV